MKQEASLRMEPRWSLLSLVPVYPRLLLSSEAPMVQAITACAEERTGMMKFSAVGWRDCCHSNKTCKLLCAFHSIWMNMHELNMNYLHVLTPFPEMFSKMPQKHKPVICYCICWHQILHFLFFVVKYDEV